MKTKTTESTDPTTGAITTTARGQTARISKDGRTLTVKITNRKVTRPAPAALPQQPTGDDLTN